MPQGLSCGCIRGFEEALVVGEKYYSRHCTHDSPPAMSFTRLGIAPGKCLGLRIKSQQDLRALLGLITLGAGRVVFLPLYKTSRLAKINGATLERRKIEKVGGFVIGGRVPVGRTFHARANEGSICFGL